MVEAREIVPGEYDIYIEGDLYRVTIPAGVGIPGVEDLDLATALVLELRASDAPPEAVIDVSQVLVEQPGILGAIEARLDAEAADGSG